MSSESRYKSPFSVDHRKPIFISKDDPRSKQSTLNKHKGRLGSKIYTTTEDTTFKSLQEPLLTLTDTLVCPAPEVTWTTNPDDYWEWNAVVPNYGIVILYEYQLSFNGQEENIHSQGETTDLFHADITTDEYLRVRAKCIYTSTFYGKWSNFV